MVVAITVTKSDLERLSVDVALTGLTPGTKYDLHRLQLRYLGDDEFGAPIYEREIPDRRALWSSVAHRVGWTAPAATATVHDYETPMRPTQWFIVPTASVSPYEYTTWTTPYPVSRGVLSTGVVHFERDLELAMEAGAKEVGHVLVRSTIELGKFVSCCVVDLDELKWTARGSEMAVLGSQYPTYVADTREARRGSIILKIDSLGKLNDIRSIVFPPDGTIHPVIFNAGSEPTMLLDDMRVVPLDVSVEQMTTNDPSLRFLSIAFIEVDPSAPLVHRSGDNDTLVNKPNANFSISDTTPRVGQWVRLRDTSTGQYDSWDWTVEQGKETDNKVGKFYSSGGTGGHQVRWNRKGKKTIKLRVFGSIAGSAGADVRTRVVTVR